MYFCSNVSKSYSQIDLIIAAFNWFRLKLVVSKNKKVNVSSRHFGCRFDKKVKQLVVVPQTTL